MNRFVNRYSWLLPLLLALFVLQGCDVKRPADILSPQVMRDFLYDFHLAKSIVDDSGYSERYKKSLYVGYIHEKHNVTQEEFDRSMKWYTRNLPELVLVYDSVAARFKSQKEEIDQLVAWQFDIPLVSKQGDTIDVWAWHQVYRLTGNPLTNKVIFTLPTDSNYVDGDSIVWHVSANYLNTESIDSIYPAMMQLALYYKNDSSLIKTQALSANGYQEIALKSDSLGKIEKIQGFIYLPPQRGEESLLIDSVSLFRYHPILLDSLAELSKDSALNLLETDTLNSAQEILDTVAKRASKVVNKPVDPSR